MEEEVDFFPTTAEVEKVIQEDDRKADMKITLTSIGIDIGTTTSHFVLSKLILRKRLSNGRLKYEVAEREILHEGPIIFTPLLNEGEVDIPKLVQFFNEELEKVEYTSDMIETGAVVITGESAKKENAERVVHELSQEIGKFVCAAAGPDFESFIAAFGAGVVQKSEELEVTVVHCDTGGGTSNTSLIKDGVILQTSCTNVGARLLILDEETKEIKKIEPPMKKVLRSLDMTKKVGDELNQDEVEKIVAELQRVLFLHLQGRDADDELAMKLLMTEPLKMDVNFKPDYYSFSGGVSEYIYQKVGVKKDTNDLGLPLGKKIRESSREQEKTLLEPEHMIRATVIGAGQYSLQVSGSTTSVDSKILPLYNIQVIQPISFMRGSDHAKVENEGKAANELHKSSILDSFARFGLKPGKETVALYFSQIPGGSYDRILDFVKVVTETIYPTEEDLKSLENIPLILIFRDDVARSVGNIIKRETELHKNVIAIDELDLQEGDFIDIGQPKVKGNLVPVVIKSLVFQKE